MKIPSTIIFLMAASHAMLGSLTPTEVESLQFMREEEKLARDVYLHLYTVHGAAQFSNIAKSEQRHMDAILYLMEQYGVADTALAESGKFTNPDLQALYDSLVASGEESLTAAFNVGVLIEETDIADLDVAIAATENADLVQVISNLRKGSYNHLGAFTRALATEAGFTNAQYQNGWFYTYMGWRRLEKFPWVQSPDGQWQYHVSTGDGGRYMARHDGDWEWTSENTFPWHFNMRQRQWIHRSPTP